MRAIVAVTGVEDSGGDLIESGAFGDLTGRRMKLCAHHDQRRPIGKALRAVELRPGDRRLPARTGDGTSRPREAGALVIDGQLNLATAAGLEALAELEFYGDDGPLPGAAKVWCGNCPGGRR